MIANQDLAARVRAAMADAGGVREVKMFGGIGFMLNDNLVAAASPRGLLVRVGREGAPQALAHPGARPMEMRGRIMADYVYVDPSALKEADVAAWIELGLAFVKTLPPKAQAKRASKKRT